MSLFCKRIVSLLLAASFVCGLCACNHEEPEKSGSHKNKYKVKESSGSLDAPSDDPPSDGGNHFLHPSISFDKPVEITFCHTMGAKLQSILELYIKDFNAIYPNIHISHYAAGGWGDISGQINTEIAGGTQPNIAYCYPDHVAVYNIPQAVVPLDDFINSKQTIDQSGELIGLTAAQVDDLVDGFMLEGQVYGDGKTYTMPMSKSTEVLYYNKTFFDENGLDVPTTWDEMWDVCEQIRSIDSDCWPLGYDAEDNWFITMCEQMNSGYTSAEDGGKFLFNNDTNKQFIKDLRTYYEKGYFTTQELYGSYTSSLFVETLDRNCYMCIGSSGGASYQMSNGDTGDGSFAFEVGVAPIPQFDTDNRHTISQGPNLCILKGSDTSEEELLASWLFVKYLCTNADFQAEFSMASGYMPVLESVSELPAYSHWLSRGDGYENLVQRTLQVCISGYEDYFVPQAFLGSSTARSVVGSLLIYCISKNLTEPWDEFIDSAFQDAIYTCEY